MGRPVRQADHRRKRSCRHRAAPWCCFPPSVVQGRGPGSLRPGRATRFLVGRASGATTTIALFFLNVSDIFAKPLTDLSSPFITGYADTSAGRLSCCRRSALRLVAAATRWTLGTKALAGALGLALATLGPITLTGHAASSGSHDLATTSLLLHVIGVTLWVGGLVALGWVALRGSKRLDAGDRPVLRR